MIERIEFSTDTTVQDTAAEKPSTAPAAMTAQTPDQADYIMTVFWRCGLTTTVSAGISSHRDDPVYVADLYQAMLERNKIRKRRTETRHETKQSSKP